jgi:hypothetical protein
VHITPLPRGISFYDVNEDGRISLFEFARTLGHNPRDLHVKMAFRSADKNGNLLIFSVCKMEFYVPVLFIFFICKSVHYYLQCLFSSGDGFVSLTEFKTTSAWVFDSTPIKREYLQFKIRVCKSVIK